MQGHGGRHKLFLFTSDMSGAISYQLKLQYNPKKTIKKSEDLDQVISQRNYKKGHIVYMHAHASRKGLTNAILLYS